MEQKILNIFSHPEFDTRAKLFRDKYDLIDIKVDGDPIYLKKNLRSYKNRTCRFCGRSYPTTPFSNYSHLLPQLIGNRNMYSDFECDKCNIRFSSFENDLAEWIGISRSITGLKSNKNTTGFMARKLRVKSRSFIGNNILIIAPEDLERDGSKTIIRYTKNAFVPANVYKALLKSSISLLKENMVRENYTQVISYLSGKSLITTGAFIFGYKLSFELSLPLHVYIFQKKIGDDKIPTHVMVFHFQNHIIGLPIPLHREDISYYKTQYDIIVPPPYFSDHNAMAIAMPVPFQQDVSSIQKIFDEEEYITIRLGEEDLKKTWLYDPATEQFRKEAYKPVGVKYLILTKENVTINPKELSAFIKQQMEKSY